MICRSVNFFCIIFSCLPSHRTIHTMYIQGENCLNTLLKLFINFWVLCYNWNNLCLVLNEKSFHLCIDYHLFMCKNNFIFVIVIFRVRIINSAYGQNVLLHVPCKECMLRNSAWIYLHTNCVCFFSPIRCELFRVDSFKHVCVINVCQCMPVASSKHTAERENFSKFSKWICACVCE